MSAAREAVACHLSVTAASFVPELLCYFGSSGGSGRKSGMDLNFCCTSNVPKRADDVDLGESGSVI